MPIATRGAAAVLCLLVGGCAHRAPEAIPAAPAGPAPVEGAASLHTQAAATYITPQQRVADEHTGTDRASAQIRYSGFTSRGVFEARSSAYAAFGRVEAHVEVDATTATFDVNTALAEASFSDTFQCDDPRAAFLQLRVVARIQTEGLPPGGGHVHGQPDVASHMFFRYTGGEDRELGGDPMRAGVILPPRVPIRAGCPVEVSVVLSTFATVPLNYTVQLRGTTVLTLESVQVLDEGGDPVPGAQVRTASGWPDARAHAGGAGTK